MIYTIGYHGLTLQQLISKLDDHAITLLVDVRTTPYSRYSADFNRPHLQRVLGKRYVWKGWCLGGKSGFRQAAYDDCLKWLVSVGKDQNVCVMCMEEDPAKCHRDMWIANDLKRLFGLDVKHIVSAKIQRQQRFANKTGRGR